MLEGGLMSSWILFLDLLSGARLFAGRKYGLAKSGLSYQGLPICFYFLEQPPVPGFLLVFAFPQFLP